VKTEDYVVIIATILIAFTLGMYSTSIHYESSAIDAGCAEYNTTTAEFQWRAK
jgi:hypothetical protein